MKETKSMQANPIQKPIFQMFAAIEKYLRKNSIADAYERWLDRYSITVSERSDLFLFEKLVQAIFSGGMKGVIVDQKMPGMGIVFDNWDPFEIAKYDSYILSQKSQSPEVIRNKPKLKAMVNNARIVCRLAEQYGSFGKYLSSLDFETLKTELPRRFIYLGPVTVHDFLRNIGFDTIKPDRHVMRWYRRTGLFSDEMTDLEKFTIIKSAAKKAGLSLARLDSIIYLFCASRNDVIPEPVCGDQPKCSKCPILNLCARKFVANFEKESQPKYSPVFRKTDTIQQSTDKFQNKEHIMNTEKLRDNAIENKDKANKLFNKIRDEKVSDFLNALMTSLNIKAERVYAVTHEFKYVLPQCSRCSLYIRPASYKVDIYFETFTMADIHRKNKTKNLPLIVKENTSNPKDQFRSVIEINGDWLSANGHKTTDLIQFINGLVDDLGNYYV